MEQFWHRKDLTGIAVIIGGRFIAAVYCKNDMGKSYIKSCDFQKILVRNLMHDFVPFKIYVYFAFACLQTLFLSVFMSPCTLPIMLAHQLVFLGDLSFEKASFIQLLGLAKVGNAHTCCDLCTVSYIQ